MSLLWENSIENSLIKDDTLQPSGSIVAVQQVDTLMKMVQDEISLKQQTNIPQIVHKSIIDHSAIVPVKSNNSSHTASQPSALK